MITISATILIEDSPEAAEALRDELAADWSVDFDFESGEISLVLENNSEQCKKVKEFFDDVQRAAARLKDSWALEELL